MGPTTAATRPQLYALVNFMGEHTDLARGLLRGADSRVRAKRLWEELCTTLNAMGGCCKSVEQWQRVWSDRKHLAKKNAAAAKKAARDSGESSLVTSTLSHLELKIVSTIGEGFGDSDIDIDTKASFSPLMDAAFVGNLCPAVGTRVADNKMSKFLQDIRPQRRKRLDTDGFAKKWGVPLVRQNNANMKMDIESNLY